VRAEKKRTQIFPSYCIPPAEFFSKMSSKLQVDRYLKSLRDHGAAKEELRELSLCQDEERRRIARELRQHRPETCWTGDKPRSLRTTKLGVDPRAHRILAESLRLAKQGAQEINSVSYLLHPPKRSNEIGRIAAIIDEIADQTNLLALNDDI